MEEESLNEWAQSFRAQTSSLSILNDRILFISYFIVYYFQIDKFLTSSPRVDEAESVGYDFLENP